MLSVNSMVLLSLFPQLSGNDPMPGLSRNALSVAMVRLSCPGNYVDGNGLMLCVRKAASARGYRD